MLEGVLDREEELDDELDEVVDELEREPEEVRELVRLLVRFSVRLLLRFLVHSPALNARFLIRSFALGGALDAAHSSAWGVRDAVSTMEARLWALLADTGSGVAGAWPPPAQRIIELALCFLPLKMRPRCREEFLGDLHALAASRASRRAQMVHALVVAGRMWSLQRALRTPPPAAQRVR